MKISSVHAWMQELPLTKSYTIAYKTISHAEIVFLEVTLENGLTGLGSCSPSPDVVNESPADALANLQQEALQQWVGRDIRHFNQLIDEAGRRYPHCPGTLAAIDLALHDAFCRYLGIPVVDLYGRKFDALPTSVTIGIKDTADMILEAKEYYANGFRILKIKTGIDVDQDIERVHKLHVGFGGHMMIRVDANTGYTISDLKKFVQATKDINIELIEQPLAPGGEVELSQLDENIRAGLAADESLLGPADALKLCHPPKPYGIFNIKLMKCGGIRAAREIALMVQHAGIRLFWGCNDESMVSIAAALHAAYSCPHTRYLDLDGSFDLQRDLVEGGFVVKEGYMHLTKAPGLGVRRTHT